MSNTYLFKSERLGFRNWKDDDIPKMQKISGDHEVMEFFPAVSTIEQTTDFVHRMRLMYSENGFCYFAVDELESEAFIGFIGLCKQTYKSEFTPCVDIGWRLDTRFWGKGYATEGAKRCLNYAFHELGLKNIKSVAPKINWRSVHVMEKIGMKQQLEFKHPALKHNKRLEDCVCYQIANNPAGKNKS